MEYLDLRGVNWTQSVNSSGTGGVFLKAKHIHKGQDHYIKLSDYNTVEGVRGHESINEVIAYRLANKLGIDCVRQKLIRCTVNIDGSVFDTVACMSKSYINKGDRRNTFENYYDTRKLQGENTIDFVRRMGMQDFIYRMFILDYLIYNRDRHGANIEILHDMSGNYRFAPLYDNGMSFLFSCHTDEEIGRFDIMIDRPVNKYIGFMSNLNNLSLIDKPVELKPLTTSDRASLFYGMSDLISVKHREAIWNMIKNRYIICAERGVIV